MLFIVSETGAFRGYTLPGMILAFAPLALVLISGFAMRNPSPAGSAALYWGIVSLIGASGAVWVLRYTGGSIASTFLITATAFLRSAIRRVGDGRGAALGRAHRLAEQLQRAVAIDLRRVAHDRQLPQHLALGLEIVAVRSRVGALQRQQFVAEVLVAAVEALADLLQR
eukprot:gene45668-61851_t